MAPTQGTQQALLGAEQKGLSISGVASISDIGIANSVYGTALAEGDGTPLDALILQHLVETAFYSDTDAPVFDAFAGSMMYPDLIGVGQDDALTFDWNFLTNEEPFFIDPFWDPLFGPAAVNPDFAFVSIENLGTGALYLDVLTSVFGSRIHRISESHSQYDRGLCFSEPVFLSVPTPTLMQMATALFRRAKKTRPLSTPATPLH